MLPLVQLSLSLSSAGACEVVQVADVLDLADVVGRVDGGGEPEVGGDLLAVGGLHQRPRAGHEVDEVGDLVAAGAAAPAAAVDQVLQVGAVALLLHGQAQRRRRDRGLERDDRLAPRERLREVGSDGDLDRLPRLGERVAVGPQVALLVVGRVGQQVGDQEGAARAEHRRRGRAAPGRQAALGVLEQGAQRVGLGGVGGHRRGRPPVRLALRVAVELLQRHRLQLGDGVLLGGDRARVRDHRRDRARGAREHRGDGAVAHRALERDDVGGRGARRLLGSTRLLVVARAVRLSIEIAGGQACRTLGRRAPTR